MGIFRENLSVRLAITAQFLLDLGSFWQELRIFVNIRIVYFLIKKRCISGLETGIFGLELDLLVPIWYFFQYFAIFGNNWMFRVKN